MGRQIGVTPLGLLGSDQRPRQARPGLGVKLWRFGLEFVSGLTRIIHEALPCMPQMQAIGRLGRMITGWRPQHLANQRGKPTPWARRRAEGILVGMLRLDGEPMEPDRPLAAKLHE